MGRVVEVGGTRVAGMKDGRPEVAGAQTAGRRAGRADEVAAVDVKAGVLLLPFGSAVLEPNFYLKFSILI